MSIEFSFRNSEYVPEGRIVSIYSPRSLHHDLDLHKIKLEGLLHGELEGVKARIRDHHLDISTKGLRSGTYRLLVESLVDSDGKQINAHPLSAILRVQKICSTLPETFRILRVLHLAVGELGTTRLKPEEKSPEGSYYVIVLKGLDFQTHCARSFAFDGRGKKVDYGEILKGVAQRRWRKFGPMEENLWHRVKNGTDEDKFSVAIWPKLDHDHRIHNNSGTRPSRLEETSSFRRPKATLLSTIEDFGAVNTNHHPDFPYITTNLTRSQIEFIAKASDVGGILPLPSKIIRTQDVGADFVGPIQFVSLSETMEMSRCLDAHNSGPDARGSGVKVAVVEDGQYGIPEDMKHNVWAEILLPITPPSEVKKNPITGQSTPHFCYVSAIIKNRQPAPHHHGFAPECDLYLGNAIEHGWTAVAELNMALIWAAQTKECSVINCSYRSEDEEYLKSGLLGHIDQLADWIATQWPYPLIVFSAGNKAPAVPFFTANRAYNGLVVGASHFLGGRMWEDSLFGNPLPQSATNDRELPDITAVGYGVTVINTNLEAGTSFSAPAVAGTAALLHGLHPALKTAPETVRAIIYASAGRRVGWLEGGGPGWWDEINRSTVNQQPATEGLHWPDLKDGAGMLDTESAVKIGRNFVDMQNTIANPPSRGGWFREIIDPQKFSLGRSPYAFTIRTPNLARPPPPPGHPQSPIIAKAAIAWSTRTTGDLRGISPPVGSHGEVGFFTSVLKERYDLAVYRAGSVEWITGSMSFDNNYEIAQWKALPGVEYKVYILFQASDFPRGARPKTIVGAAWQFFLDGKSL